MVMEALLLPRKILRAVPQFHDPSQGLFWELGALDDWKSTRMGL
jgi:hypothetical protein